MIIKKNMINYYYIFYKSKKILKNDNYIKVVFLYF